MSHKKDLCECGNPKDVRSEKCKICYRPQFFDEKEYHYQYNKKISQELEHKQKVRNTWLKRQFGIDLIEYEKMLKDQNSKCFICGNLETVSSNNGRGYNQETKNQPRNLSVDHDSETGTIRKLLCFKCNVSLGGFNHDPALLRKAANYLEAYGNGSSGNS